MWETVEVAMRAHRHVADPSVVTFKPNHHPLGNHLTGWDAEWMRIPKLTLQKQKGKSGDAIIKPLDFGIMWNASAARKDIYMAVCLFLHLYATCVCALWPCASLGLCLLKTVVCWTVILFNGLSLPADVFFSAPQLHHTCFHAISQCSSPKRSSVDGGSGGGRFLLCTRSCCFPPLHLEYCSSTLSILGPEMSPVG